MRAQARVRGPAPARESPQSTRNRLSGGGIERIRPSRENRRTSSPATARSKRAGWYQHPDAGRAPIRAAQCLRIRQAHKKVPGPSPDRTTAATATANSTTATGGASVADSKPPTRDSERDASGAVAERRTERSRTERNWTEERRTGE